MYVPAKHEHITDSKKWTAAVAGHSIAASVSALLVNTYLIEENDAHRKQCHPEGVHQCFSMGLGIHHPNDC